MYFIQYFEKWNVLISPVFLCRNWRPWPGTQVRWIRLCFLTSLWCCSPLACSSQPGSLCILHNNRPVNCLLSLPVHNAGKKKYSVLHQLLVYVLNLLFSSYEVTSTKYTRDIYKELLISLVASLFMGFGVLFLLLWVGIYVWRWGFNCTVEFCMCKAFTGLVDFVN